MIWEGSAHFGQYYLWEGHPGLYKKTGWVSYGEQAIASISLWFLFNLLLLIPSAVASLDDRLQPARQLNPSFPQVAFNNSIDHSSRS